MADSNWKEYKVDLRAIPDTPLEEERAAKQGRTLGPQTVIYRLYANSAEEAGKKAIEIEMRFLYRKEVWIMSVEQVQSS